jgi:predicted DNA-binding transcriptional regulator
MNYCNNEEEEIKKFSAELKEIKKSQPVGVKLPEIAIFAMITQIQLASRHPNATSEFTEIAISVAAQLQEIFKKYPVTYEILEMGWNREHDRPIRHEQ